MGFFKFFAVVFVVCLLKGMASFVPSEEFPCYQGIASWYSEADPGVQRLTASGEVFDDGKATCASWVFPLGTYVRVTNIQDGKFVVCRVNDRGPDKSLNRVVDLTKSSFEKIANPEVGLLYVRINPIKKI